MIMIRNTTNSRAFTLDEIVVATQDYIQKIGQGGFGSVFLGKLPEGNLIAVKVLSLFSKQGIHEFLNEVNCRYYFVIWFTLLNLIMPVMAAL